MSPADAPAGGLLAGRAALITGACGAMGRATVRRFLAEGARVHALDRDVDAAAALDAELHGASLSFAACFLASERASFITGATILADGGRTAL